MKINMISVISIRIRSVFTLPLGAIRSCSYSGKERERGEERRERSEGRRWEKLGFSSMDHCRFHSSSKIIGGKILLFPFVFWKIDARVWQFLWIS